MENKVSTWHWCYVSHILWCSSWLVGGVDVTFSPHQREQWDPDTPEWTLAPPPDPPTAHWKSFWLVGWEAATACHWSVSIVLTSRERVVWEAVNIFDIKPWNVFLFQFSFRSDVWSFSLNLMFFIHVLQFQCQNKESSERWPAVALSPTSTQDELQRRTRTGTRTRTRTRTLI